MTMKYRFFFLFCLLLPLLASAQITPKTTGLYLSAGISGQSVAYDDEDFEEDGTGGGLELRIGYGFSPTFTAYAGFSGAGIGGDVNTPFVEDYGLGIFELGGRFHFGKKLKSPTFYAEASLQGVAATYDKDYSLKLNGAGLGLGAGLLLWTGSKFSIDLGLRSSFGRINDITFERVTIDISEDNFNYSVGRLYIGATWFL